MLLLTIWWNSTLYWTVRDIIKTNGVGGLWRGTLPTIVRYVNNWDDKDKD